MLRRPKEEVAKLKKSRQNERDQWRPMRRWWSWQGF